MLRRLHAHSPILGCWYGRCPRSLGVLLSTISCYHSLSPANEPTSGREWIRCSPDSRHRGSCCLDFPRVVVGPNEPTIVQGCGSGSNVGIRKLGAPQGGPQVGPSKTRFWIAKGKSGTGGAAANPVAGIHAQGSPLITNLLQHEEQLPLQQ